MKDYQSKRKEESTGTIHNTKALLCIPGFLIILTILCSVVLTSSQSYADTEKKSNVAVIVNTACTITTGGGSYAKVISPGTAEEIAGNGINVTCNDSNGYALYTAGFSGDEYNTTNSTKMISSDGSSTISTGTSGSNSYWAMKASGSSDISTTPTIDSSFSSYQNIPTTYTKLSHYAGATLGATTNSVTTPTYKVYVASSQAANTYTGKVKYLLVHPNSSTNPIVNMQNWTGCSSMNIGDSTFLIDTRDKQAYNVIKFNDGKCWMTTNLNLAGGTALSATDTDVTSDYITNFTTSNNLTKNGDTLVLPASSTTGFDTDNYSYVANSGSTTCGNNSPCYSYYSWDAATLGSGRSISASNTNAPYSICPKGWHLPTTRDGTDSTSDIRQLIIILGGSSSIAVYNTTTSPTGATIFQALSNSNLVFLRAGNYIDSTFVYGGSNGLYWSATSGSSTRSRPLYFNSTYLSVAGWSERKEGFSIRCLTE